MTDIPVSIDVPDSSPENPRLLMEAQQAFYHSLQSEEPAAQSLYHVAKQIAMNAGFTEFDIELPVLAVYQSKSRLQLLGVVQQTRPLVEQVLSGEGQLDTKDLAEKWLQEELLSDREKEIFTKKAEILALHLAQMRSAADGFPFAKRQQQLQQFNTASAIKRCLENIDLQGVEVEMPW